ncbi:procathepsin L-like [Coccinella septempunctata]|uniref:procathepsin L-like n=1 Tax=Coccinella septempunctata TaxID=41139 RepID=UPI001D09280C|nr:procathepsin L-like [Coccinella septempunctata]
MNPTILFTLALSSLASAQFPLLSQSPIRLTGAQGNAQSLPNIAGRFDFNPSRRKEPGITNFGPFQSGNIPNFTLTATRIATGVKNIPQTLEQVLVQDWGNFKSAFKKAYTAAEEALRKEIFIENRQSVIDFNTRYSSGEVTYTQQLNPFADLLPHEFSQRLNGFNRSSLTKRVKLPSPTAFVPSANVNIPERMDWRDQNAVTAVKFQGDCMSCYAFASAGALESHTFRKTGKLVDLSPQQILDCSKGYGNEGCNGGLMTDAYEYVKTQPGLDTWDSYPYEGKDGECRFKQESVEAYCTGFVELPEGDEKALEYAVATIGPVTVAIDASQRGFQFYKDGIYLDPNCKNKQEEMNHGVLVIGYGTEPDGKKYWLVKNSYGPQWGNGGYVKMAKDAGNHCGIANSASYPLV